MRIVDKMILLNRFLNENEQKRLEIEDHQLQNVTDHYKNQSRYWKNKEKYNEFTEAWRKKISESEQEGIAGGYDDIREIVDLVVLQEVTFK